MWELLALSSSQPARLTFSLHLTTFAAELCAPRPANFLSADGDALFAHGDRRDGTSVVWVASVPLTDDPWQPLNGGELVAIRNGVIMAGASPGSSRDRAARTNHAV